MVKFFKSTPKTKPESEDLLKELTDLIIKGQYDDFQQRMVTLTDNLKEWPSLFSTLLVEVVHYLPRDDQSELRSRFYPDLIKYTAPKDLVKSLNRQSGNELWESVLRDVAISGKVVTQIPYSSKDSKETFRDMQKCPFGGTKGLQWKTNAYQHNYCLIMAFPLIVRVALAVTELECCDLENWRAKISKTEAAIFDQSKEDNPLPYIEFKTKLSEQPWWTQG
jgi:hypothetical protein